jgi:hypothetical protein
MYKISRISNSSLGTTEFNLEAKGHRGEQRFTTYPISKGATEVLVQSGKRIGRYNPSTGLIRLSKSYSGGAYFHNWTMDAMKKQLVDVQLSEADNEALKKVIYRSSPNGSAGLLIVDNEGACDIMTM